MFCKFRVSSSCLPLPVANLQWFSPCSVMMLHLAYWPPCRNHSNALPSALLPGHRLLHCSHVPLPSSFNMDQGGGVPYQKGKDMCSPWGILPLVNWKDPQKKPVDMKAMGTSPPSHAVIFLSPLYPERTSPHCTCHFLILRIHHPMTTVNLADASTHLPKKSVGRGTQVSNLPLDPGTTS